MFSHKIPTEELDKAIAQHALWLQTVGRKGKRLDLSGSILNGRNLSRLDLRGAVLRGAQLSWVNLSGSNLSEADLCGATMNHAVCADTIFLHANLSGVNLHCADLTGAELTDAIMLHADMKGAICRTEQPAVTVAQDNLAPIKVAVEAARLGVQGYGGAVVSRLRKMVSTCTELLAPPKTADSPQSPPVANAAETI